MAESSCTAGELARLGERRFRAARIAFGHGTLTARDEAIYLLLYALGLPPDRYDPSLVVPARESRKALALFERRVHERRPAAYLTREAWLGDYRFFVDERVIVPRSYIAELLRDRLSPWLPNPAGMRSALDLCTGSGCLAIMLADIFRRTSVDAVDISRDALAVARRNVATYGMQRRVHLVHSDMFSALSGRRYDLIVSNPPYVRSTVMKRLPAEYRREPRIALAGGADGLDAVRTILREAPDYLKPGGLLVVECGHNRRAVERAFPRLPIIWPLTSGGDDCVFLLGRADFSEPPVARSVPASLSDERPQARKVRRSARAAGAKATR